MKRTLCLVAAAALAAGPALAQKSKPAKDAAPADSGGAAPAPAKPAPAATPAPAGAPAPASSPATASGLTPAPAAPAAPADLGPFKTPAERRSYAMGAFLANQIRNSEDGSRKINYAEVEAGMKAIFNGDKSLDLAQGMTIGAMIKRDDTKIDVDALLAAFRDTAAGTKPKLDDVALRAEMNSVQQEINENRRLKGQAEAARNLKIAEEFLAKNKTEKDVQATASGLQYKVLKPGTNDRKPAPTDMVSVKYVATMLDGREFDRTQGDAPRTVPLSIGKGWGEGLQLMTIGSKYRLWVPPVLGWGEGGRGIVRPNSLLVYEVELLDAIPAPQQPTQPGVVATPPVAIPRNTAPADPNRKPITAVTPPVSVEIPPGGGKPIITPGDNPNPNKKIAIPPREGSQIIPRPKLNPNADPNAPKPTTPATSSTAPPATPPPPANPPEDKKQ